jgi:5-methylcytosine-specific restriction protein B
MVPGRFVEFCEEAATRSGASVLVIDEINRANLSQVFGELMYLLEYRDRDLPLAGGRRLRIPPNVRIIGTMNTADRSIALVDHALRRRFAFLRLDPSVDVLTAYHERRGVDVSGLAGVLTELNATIADPHSAVGISFFLREQLDEHLEAIWESEIEPYVEELLYDRRKDVERFRWSAVEARARPEVLA